MSSAADGSRRSPQQTTAQQSPARRVVLVSRGHSGNRLAGVLRGSGFHVLRATTVTEGLATAGDADVAILDLDETSPHEETETVAAFGRAGAPVIVVASPRPLRRRVTMLEAGADNYLSKPVAPAELVARVRVLLRRSARARRRSARVRAGSLDIDFRTRTATVEGQAVPLTAIEWRILEELASHPGAVLDHQHLTTAVWGKGQPTDTRSLRVHISNLRRKLTGAGVPLISTDHGLGYRWRGPSPNA